MEKERLYLFVYGSLRKHECNHFYMQGAELLASQCWTHGRLFDTGRGYPAMVVDGASRVYGELYAVTPEQLQAIDELEGYRGEGQENEYDRIVRTIYTDRGERKALVYVFPPNRVEAEREIPSGDWKVHRLLGQAEHYYFAYGSCMDEERFRLAGVDHLFRDVAGRGVLHGFSHRYTLPSGDGGKADIVEVGGRVEGKVYRIGQEAVRYLLVREGVESGRYRPTFVDVEIDGRLQKDALTFTVVDKQEETPPSPAYAAEILRGALGTVSETYYEELERHLRERFGMAVR